MPNMEIVRLISCCWLLAGLMLATQISASSQSAAPVVSFDFKGRFLVSVSDADMIPSAYFNGKLGPAQGADALSIIRLDRAPSEYRAVEISISNSVTGPPVAVVVSPDGRYAVVGERLGQRPQNKTAPLLDDLLPARTLTVVDLADPDKPKIVQQVNGPERANAPSSRGGRNLRPQKRSVRYPPSG